MAQFHALTIPLYGTEDLPDDAFPAIREAVQTHGYKVFDPRIVQRLAAESKVKDVCSVLFALFLRFLADEHATALEVARPERDDFYFVVFGQPMEEGLHQMQDCKGIIPAEVRASLFGDLYGQGNSPAFFRHVKLSGKTSRPFFTARGTKDKDKVTEWPVVRTTEEGKSSWPLLYIDPRQEQLRRDNLGEDDDDLYRELLQDEVQAFAFLTAVVLLDSEWRYLGHVYVWPSSHATKTLSMERIRSSIGNLKCRWASKISLKLLSAVQQFATLHGFDYIAVNRPIGPMRTLLPSLGFQSSPSGLQTISTDELKQALSDEPRVQLINPNECHYPYKQLDRILQEKKLFPEVEPDLARVVLYRHPLYYTRIKDFSKHEFYDIWKERIKSPSIPVKRKA